MHLGKRVRLCNELCFPFTDEHMKNMGSLHTVTVTVVFPDTLEFMIENLLASSRSSSLRCLPRVDDLTCSSITMINAISQKWQQTVCNELC